MCPTTPLPPRTCRPPAGSDACLAGLPGLDSVGRDLLHVRGWLRLGTVVVNRQPVILINEPPTCQSAVMLNPSGFLQSLERLPQLLRHVERKPGVLYIVG